jgi:predicted lipid-binding transport protein (Tim44 family)
LAAAVAAAAAALAGGLAGGLADGFAGAGFAAAAAGVAGGLGAVCACTLSDRLAIAASNTLKVDAEILFRVIWASMQTSRRRRPSPEFCHPCPARLR